MAFIVSTDNKYTVDQTAIDAYLVEAGTPQEALAKADSVRADLLGKVATELTAVTGGEAGEIEVNLGGTTTGHVTIKKDHHTRNPRTGADTHYSTFVTARMVQKSTSLNATLKSLSVKGADLLAQ